MTINVQVLAQQLEGIVAEYEAMAPRSQHSDLSDLPEHERQALVTRAVAAVRRIAGERSAYAGEVERIFKTQPLLHEHTPSIIGVARALLADANAGYLQSLVELVHADTFSDFLEMAQYLQESGYKDAAAVVAGSTLESHLRSLCVKSGLPTAVVKPDGTSSPKKADAMNSDLAAASVYAKLDQKNVTAWLDLRNKAAHGKYTEYLADQVALLIGGIRDFITRVPS